MGLLERLLDCLSSETTTVYMWWTLQLKKMLKAKTTKLEAHRSDPDPEHAGSGTIGLPFPEGAAVWSEGYSLL